MFKSIKVEHDFIAKTFLPEVIELPILSETFCNFLDIPFEKYNGPLEHLITDDDFRTGKLIHFYPMHAKDPKKTGGFTWVNLYSLLYCRNRFKLILNLNVEMKLCSSLFILDVTPKSQKGHKFGSATNILRIGRPFFTSQLKDKECVNDLDQWPRWLFLSHFWPLSNQ